MHALFARLFRRSQIIYESARFELHGLVPDKRYVLRNRDEAGTREATSKELMEKGFLVAAPKAPLAVTLTYQQVDRKD